MPPAGSTEAGSPGRPWAAGQKAGRPRRA